MIYGSTGVTHFDQLAEILTGYEITLFGARSGGIFLGILFIAVGSLFKITAVPFRAAVGRPVVPLPTDFGQSYWLERGLAYPRARETHHYLVRALRP